MQKVGTKVPFSTQPYGFQCFNQQLNVIYQNVALSQNFTQQNIKE